MQETTIRWGDGYAIVEPSFPDSLPNKLRYWHRSLEWSEEQMRRVALGQYQELYTIRTWIDEQTQQYNQQLMTMPGFVHRIKMILKEAGWTYRIIDERTPFPQPDLKRACEALYDHQVPCACTAVLSGGGIIACPTGWGKCVSPSTPILYKNGEVKMHADIQVGDVVMGDDSGPRTVLDRIDGFGPMYRITPIKGQPFEVADHHILCLVQSGNCKRDKYVDGHVVLITVADYLKQSKTFKHRHKLYRVPVEFPAQIPSIDPYYLGLWLGDGTWNKPEVTSADPEVLAACVDYAQRLGLKCVTRRLTTNNCVPNRAISIALVGELNGTRHRNVLRTNLYDLGFCKEHLVKFIPQDYLCNSREHRLQLLAGLLDSDGNLNEGTDFEYVSTHKILADQTTQLARGLGFNVTETVRLVRGFGVESTAYRLRITGPTHLIPTRIPRKQARIRTQVKHCLRTGFKIERIADGPYVGIRTDGNQRYLMGDCTVLHNTHIMKAIINAFDPEDLKARGTPLVVLATPDKDITAKDYKDLCKMLPDREIGLVMSGSSKFSDDIQVITLDSLHRLNPDDVGVVVVDEVHAAASDKRAESLLRFRKAARWGVSATPTGRFDGRDLVTEGLFGPVVYTRSYAEGVADGALVPITVYWIESPEPPMGMAKFEKFTSRVGRYRNGVLRNPARNALIGQLMQELPKDMQVLGIMQYLEHMDHLLPLCGPGVEIVHAETDAAEIAKRRNLHAVSPQQRREIYQRMEAAEIRRILSTYVYKQGVNFPHLEVVINVGGGGSDIVAKQIPGRESRKTNAKERSYLIDFWHPWDRRKNDRNRIVPGYIHADDQSREKAYNHLGFEQIWIKDLTALPSHLRPA